MREETEKDNKGRAYCSSSLRAITAWNHPPFFKIFSHFVPFCSIFQVGPEKILREDTELRLKISFTHLLLKGNFHEVSFLRSKHVNFLASIPVNWYEIHSGCSATCISTPLELYKLLQSCNYLIQIESRLWQRKVLQLAMQPKRLWPKDSPDFDYGVQKITFILFFLIIMSYCVTNIKNLKLYLP